MWTSRKDAEGLTEIIHTVNGQERVYCKCLHLHDAMELIHFLNERIDNEVKDAIHKHKGGE